MVTVQEHCGSNNCSHSHIPISPVSIVWTIIWPPTTAVIHNSTLWTRYLFQSRPNSKFQIPEIWVKCKSIQEWRESPGSTVEILCITHEISSLPPTCINRCSAQPPRARQDQEVWRAGWRHTGARAHCQWSAGGSTAMGSGYEYSLKGKNYYQCFLLCPFILINIFSSVQ